MKSEILVAFRLATSYIDRLSHDITDEQIHVQPPGVNNHAAWILGHLCYSFQAIAGEIGVAPWLPDCWTSLFATATTPQNSRGVYPTAESLRRQFRDATQRLQDAVERLDDDRPGKPLSDAEYRKTLPTIGHALAHIMIGHTSIHAGQLSVWRSAVGLPRETESFDNGIRKTET